MVGYTYFRKNACFSVVYMEEHTEINLKVSCARQVVFEVENKAEISGWFYNVLVSQNPVFKADLKCTLSTAS